MSSEYSGNKDKRSKLSSETNKSFVKNVTSRVSGLFPSTITKWFGASSSSNANGSTVTAESTDSSTEDEATESSMPPAKRMRYTPAKTPLYNPIHTKCTSTNTESIEQLNAAPPPSASHGFRRDTSFLSHVQSHSEDPSLVENESQTKIFNVHGSMSSTNKSIDRKRKCLFDKPSSDSLKTNEKSSSSSVRDQSQPYFKSTLLGSPFYSGRTMYGGAASSYVNQPSIKHRKVTSVEPNNTDNVAISHSARRVLDLLENYSSPLLDAKRIPQIAGTSKNNIQSYLDSSTTSSRKSLSYETQQLHVPSIATILRLKRKSRLMDTTNAARQIIASQSSTSDYSPYPINPSNQQMETPNKLTTKIKSRLTRTNRDQESPKLSNINFPSASLQIDQNNLPKFSFGNNSDNVKTSSAATSHSIDTQTQVKTFATKSTHMEQDTSSSDGNNTGLRNLPAQSIYKCSSPVIISTEASLVTTSQSFIFGSPERRLERVPANKSLPSKSKETFNVFDAKNSSAFNSEKSEKDDNIPANKVSLASKSMAFGINGPNLISGSYDAKSEKDQKAKESDCFCNLASNVNNMKKCTKCNKSDSIDKISSVNSLDKKCEVCSGNNKSKTNCNCVSKKSDQISNNTAVKLNNVDETDNPKWKCEDCWVVNNADSQKCVCCGASKPTKKLGGSEKQGNTSIIKDKPNNIEGDWKCDICWIKNKSNDDKCAACGGAKPGQTINKINSNKSAITDSRDNIIKSQNKKWECSICLVGNDDNRSTCVCCEAERPGTKKVLQNTSFSFGQTNMKFKFGINPIENSKEKQNAEEKSESVLDSSAKKAEANNNNLIKLPAFTSVPTTKEEETNNDSNKLPAPKSTFTFGIPKQVTLDSETKSEPSKPTFTFSVKSTVNTNKSSNESDDKNLPLPKFDSLPIKLPETSATPTNLFVLPKQNVENKTTTSLLPSYPKSLFSTTPNTTDTDKKNDTNVTAPPITTSAIEAKTLPNAFVFSASASTSNPSEKLLSSSIGSVTNVNTTSSPFAPTAMTMFQKVEPANSSTSLSLFPNKESTPTTTSSLFSQKTDTTVTQSAPAPTPAIFSFGSAQNTGPQEKPMFNFSFSSSNKTETNLFKPPTFGNVTDNSVTTNKFSFSATSPLATTNSLTGNTLGSNNSLVTGNVAPSNVVTGSKNTTTGNALSNVDVPASALNTGNNISINSTLATVPQAGIFGAPVQKDNMWSANNNMTSNLFVSSASSSTLQKPATFTFGSPTAFGSNTNTSTFGTPTTGQQTQNIFGISANQNNNQPSLFSTPVQNATPQTNMFANNQTTNNSTPSMGLFGGTNIGASTFGTTNPPVPTFEAPTVTPSASPFSFGAQQQPPAVFGFSQQQQPQQPQPGSVYNFGASGGTTSSVQFNMGSTSNPSVRRFRKAIRRTTQR